MKTLLQKDRNIITMAKSASTSYTRVAAG